MNHLTVRANVVFFGLTAAVAAALSDAISKFAGDVHASTLANADECLDVARESGAEVIFCQPDAKLVADLRRHSPNAVIIAASRIPDTDVWLEVIEAGADDYCAAPFEPHQLRWIIESNLSLHSAAA
jgi:DNA-binding response OmpR family regulator